MMPIMETEAQQHFHQQIGEALEELFPETFEPISDTASFFVRAKSPDGSWPVAVEVLPFGDDDAVIRLFSVVAKNPRLTPDVMALLLQANNQSLPFAHFGIAPDGAVVVEQVLVASGCRGEDLYRFSSLIAEHADEWAIPVATSGQNH